MESNLGSSAVNGSLNIDSNKVSPMYLKALTYSYIILLYFTYIFTDIEAS